MTKKEIFSLLSLNCIKFNSNITNSYRHKERCVTMYSQQCGSLQSRVRVSYVILVLLILYSRFH